MEEEAWRVPMIVVDPGGATKGKVDLEHLSTGVDITATICDYAQVPMMPKMTIAKSLKPLVEGQEVAWRDHIVGESFHGQQVAVRDQQHKTILYLNPKMQAKVFDLKADPLEMKNLVDTPGGREPSWRTIRADFSNSWTQSNSTNRQARRSIGRTSCI